jgi:hypothetical protein
MLTPTVKPQWVRYKLDETIEQPCSDLLAHTSEVCKGAISAMGIQLSKDNHDSWGMCTTSAECKTVITIVLTVMSSMDPHMISGTWDEFWLSLQLGCVEVGLLGCGSVTVRLRDAIKIVIFDEMSLLPYY